MLRTYQEELAQQAAGIIAAHGVAYLAMEVRTGKTLTALRVAAITGARSVLFITKKKAMESINMDYRDKSGASYHLEVVNYESLHKVIGTYQLIICDEAHGLGAFPKPSARALTVRGLVEANGADVLLLSGTPTPETYAQMFHQLWAAGCKLWAEYKNFYAWHKVYGHERKQWIAGREIAVYDSVDQGRIGEEVKPFMLSYTQQAAGFSCEVVEEFITLPMPARLKAGIDMIRRDKNIQTKDGYLILADTAAKEMQKVHQLCGGTIKTDEGHRLIIDTSKAEAIRERFGKMKVAVFYCFIAEREVLVQVLGEGCTTPEEFNAAAEPCLILLQIRSGREGVNLSTADVLVMYNIDHAAVSYWQARARLQTLDRPTPARVVWLQFQGGIECKIYAAVMDKKDYTVSHYRGDFK